MGKKMNTAKFTYSRLMSEFRIWQKKNPLVPYDVALLSFTVYRYSFIDFVPLFLIFLHLLGGRSAVRIPGLCLSERY